MAYGNGKIFALLICHIFQAFIYETEYQFLQIL